LSVGLFCFTLAGALYAGHRILRWSSAALGLVLLALGTAIVVLTEMS
jgi:hypothetical protein